MFILLTLNCFISCSVSLSHSMSLCINNIYISRFRNKIKPQYFVVCAWKKDGIKMVYS